MPEAPECHIITKQLAQHFVGKEISAINIIGGRFVKTPPTNLESLSFPLNISDIKCKGKFIYWRLGEYDLWNTLGMTGSWSLSKTKHSAVEFIIDGKSVYFTDPRHFGTIKFMPMGELENKLNSLGMEFIGIVQYAEFHYKMKFNSKYSKRTVAERLMDQSICCGVGNYIKSEALYRAKISPLRMVETLSNDELNSLYESIREVINSSIALGGATLATYQDFNGQAGSFAKCFKVYKQQTDPEGRKVISETTADGRTSWWCPEVQK